MIPTPDLPDVAIEIVAEMKETHHVVKYSPNDDLSLEYTLILPKGWIAETVLPGSSGAIGEPQIIGLFSRSAAKRTPLVTVAVCKMPIEVNIVDWVEFLIAQDDWLVFSSKERSTPQGEVVDVGATRGKGHATEVMRVIAYADGGRVFLTSGSSFAHDWDNWKYDFLAACTSMKLVRPTGSDALEPLKEWEDTASGFGVAFPASWKLEKLGGLTDSDVSVDIRLADGDQLLAYLHVSASRNIPEGESQIQQLLAQAESRLQDSGFKVKGETIAPAFDESGKQVPGYLMTAIQYGEFWQEDVEIRMGFRRVGDTYISIMLISVTQESNPFLWMRSKRAFEIVREFNWLINGGK